MLSSILSKLLTPRPLPPNDVLEKSFPLMRKMLFRSDRVLHSELLSVLSILSQDRSPQIFQRFIDDHLFSPILFLLQKQDSSSLLVESALEIIFNFCSFSAGNCQYLICLGLLPVFQIVLKKHTNITARANTCRCLTVIASSCPMFISFEVLLECGLVFQVLIETKRKTRHAEECFLMLTSLPTLPSHLAYLLRNDVIILLKSMLHSETLTAAATNKIISLLEKILLARDADELPLIAAVEIQSVIGFELRKLMASEDPEISGRAKAIMELE